jgi:pyruvate/2-oxoglutarate dehydrogenase complex dihydrolipoamide acyltransferase (E2) component
MPTGPDEDADVEEGPVLSPEELDISDDERVMELDDGRYVVSSGDPIAGADDGPAGELESGGSEARASSPAADEPEPEPEPTPDPTPQPAPGGSGQSQAEEPAELTEQAVHRWLTEDLHGSNSRYGFDITAAFDGSVAQQRMVSNDVVTIFENLVMWYAQQIDRDTPVEEVLGILLMEANAPIRYPPKAIKRALQRSGLTPEDSIADLIEVVGEDEGFQL